MNKVFVSTLFCCWAAGALAQNSVLSLRTILLDGSKMPESYIRVVDEDGISLEKVPWPDTQPSEPLRVMHDGTLKLLRSSKDPDGKEVLEVLREIKLPGSAEEVLLLGTSDSGEDHYVAIEDIFLKAKFNDWLAVNSGPQPVILMVGDKGKPIKVEAESSRIFRPQIEELTGVKIIAQAEYRGEMRTFLSTYWPAFSKQRTMVIFFRDGERMRGRRISDRFIRKPEEPGAILSTQPERN